MNELLNLKELKKDNKMLFIFTIFFMIIAIIFNSCYWIVRKENIKLDKENAKLEQQVIDYKWQLEQVQYIMEYQKGE